MTDSEKLLAEMISKLDDKREMPQSLKIAH